MGRVVDYSLRVRLRAGRVAWLGISSCMAACLCCAHAWGAQATLVADAHVNSAMLAANSGAISNLDVGGGYATLLQFDLSQLPAGTTATQVSRAVLRLYANRVTAPGPVTFAAVTGTWGEYSVTYATQPSVGGAAGVFPVSQAGAFVAVDVTSLVQGWITNPATNNGLALSASAAIVQFDSKENDQTAHAATLDVELVKSGLAGPQGPAGATGAQGSAGLTGAAGPAGVAGAIGLAGAAGSQGLTGATGSIGPKGLTGATGPMGSQGLSGPAGSQGAAGSTGPAGLQGPAGAPGGGGLAYQGNYSSTQNYAQGDVVVWQGSSYASLVAGNHGSTPSFSPQQWGVLSAQGPAGSTGATGASGPVGPQGLPGSVGPNGPSGPQGLQGIAGQAGAQGIPGATGATGLSGPMGPLGPSGPVGLSFRSVYSSMTNYALAEGVSYKGAGYVSLVASNHGNTPDQSPLQWALFAAAGADGATGPAGAVGATGTTGPGGPQGSTGGTGPTGAIGPQGPPVANYLANYQSSVNYARNDAVSWQGSTYISLVAGNLGQTPSLSPTLWAVLAAQGAAGPTGPVGSAGAAGAPGGAGASGAIGPQGPPVTFRAEWLAGTSYATGDAVAYGGSGYIALSANRGREPDMSPVYWGLLAAAGAAGVPGPQGAQGLEGPTGYAGQKGDPGPQGSAGPTGAAGSAGATGSTGPAGTAGSIGPTGATGANGIAGIGGANGTNGASGSRGMTFIGPWVPGYGYRADDAVTYGNPASTYIAVSVNTSQDPVDYPGVWTMLAQAGGAGPAGPTGPIGQPTTVGVNPVTVSGLPGTNASVTNTGTSSAVVLQFTIPQGAAGAPGGGGAVGGSIGNPSMAAYHTVFSGSYLLYYSVSNSTSTPSEPGALIVPYSVLTWIPNGCTATALNVHSLQNNPITVTLRVSTTSSPSSMADTTLVCSPVAKNAACSATGSIKIPSDSFVDLRIDGADTNQAAVWTALTCN